MTADYYRHIARVLEAGKFHLGFFDDRLAMPTVTAATTPTPSPTASAA